MYDELIKRLRECATEVNCTGCDCNNLLMKQAADAIEDLQKQLQESEVDNINLTGWLAEEHAKVEELQTKLKKAEIEINHLDGLVYSLQDELGNALY